MLRETEHDSSHWPWGFSQQAGGYWIAGTCALLGPVAGRQHLVGVDPHHKVADLVRSDLREPMGGVRRNDDDITRSDLAGLPVDDLAATGTWAVERRDDGAVGGRFFHVLDRFTRHECPGAGNNEVDFRDLDMLDAETDMAAFRLGPMNDADNDFLLAIDAHHSDLLIAHRRRRGFLRRRENLSIADVRRRTTRQMLDRRRRLSLCLTRDGKSEQ